MNLLWIDLETTGLDPQQDHVLELAWILTDMTPEFNVLTELTHGSVRVAVGDPDPKMTHTVWAMHLASGLWIDWANGEQHPLHDLLQELEEEVATHGPLHQTIMAGHGIHFDQAFLYAKAPGFVESLHYRLFDVRTLQSAAEMTGWVAPEFVGHQHRAADDINHSLRVAREVTQLMKETRDE